MGRVKKTTPKEEGKDSSMPDFYYENGLMVFTEAWHLKRGYCCKNNCRHCPWKNDNK